MNFQTIRVGRKRNPNVIRDSTGKSRGESPLAAMATGITQRCKEMGIADPIVWERDGRTIYGIERRPEVEDLITFDKQTGKPVSANPDAGHILGRLRMIGKNGDLGGVSEVQFDAGWNYANLVRRHSAIMGTGTGEPKSPSFTMIGGASLSADPRPETIRIVRQQFNECYDALMEAGVAIGQNVRVATITYDVCLDRMSYAIFRDNTGALGNLKIGLNALVRVLR